MNLDFINPLKNKDFRQKLGTLFVTFLTGAAAAVIAWLNGVLAGVPQ